MIPMILELQHKLEKIRKMVGMNTDSAENVISAVFDDREALRQFSGKNTEMKVSKTVPSVKFQVVLPGELFLEKFLMATNSDVKLDIPLPMEFLRRTTQQLINSTNHSHIKTILDIT